MVKTMCDFKLEWHRNGNTFRLSEQEGRDIQLDTRTDSLITIKEVLTDQYSVLNLLPRPIDAEGDTSDFSENIHAL